MLILTMIIMMIIMIHMEIMIMIIVIINMIMIMMMYSKHNTTRTVVLMRVAARAVPQPCRVIYGQAKYLPMNDIIMVVGQTNAVDTYEITLAGQIAAGYPQLCKRLCPRVASSSVSGSVPVLPAVLSAALYPQLCKRLCPRSPELPATPRPRPPPRSLIILLLLLLLVMIII